MLDTIFCQCSWFRDCPSLAQLGTIRLRVRTVLASIRLRMLFLHHWEHLMPVTTGGGHLGARSPAPWLTPCSAGIARPLCNNFYLAPPILVWPPALQVWLRAWNTSCLPNMPNTSCSSCIPEIEEPTYNVNWNIGEMCIKVSSFKHFFIQRHILPNVFWKVTGIYSAHNNVVLIIFVNKLHCPKEKS